VASMRVRPNPDCEPSNHKMHKAILVIVDSVGDPVTAALLSASSSA